MQYKSENEHVVKMNTPYTPLPNQSSLTEDLQIKRTRKILMIILGVFLTLSVINLISAIFEFDLKTEGVNTQRSAQLFEALISIVFYGFGLFAAHHYFTLGLRIFAWLMIIGLVVIGIGLVGILLVILRTSSTRTPFGDVHSKNAGIGETVLIILSFLITTVLFIILVIIVKFTFKLARIIDANKSLIIQQI